jgi:hypothetical protein
MPSQCTSGLKPNKEIRKGANLSRVFLVLLPPIADYHTAQFEGSNYSRAEGREGSVE